MRTSTAPREGRTLFLVGDDPGARAIAADALVAAGFVVLAFASACEALGHLQRLAPAVVICDARHGGFQLLERVQAADPHVPVIMVTARGDVPTAVRAIHLGAHGFVERPYPFELLLGATRKALSHRMLRLERARLADEMHRLSHEAPVLLGSSPAIVGVRHQVEQLAGMANEVLIVGEAGTGKKLVARLLHRLGPRGHAGMVTANCACLPQAWLEHELFGHDGSAARPTKQPRAGKLAQAHGSSMLLDQVDAMSVTVQQRLLQALPEPGHAGAQIGGIPWAGPRLLATTSADLPRLVEGRQFHPALHQRLRRNTVHLPALRDRRCDIPELLEHFLARSAAGFGRPVPPLQVRQWQQLAAHAWPGNVRELRHVAECIVLGLPVLDAGSWHPRVSTAARNR